MEQKKVGKPEQTSKGYKTIRCGSPILNTGKVPAGQAGMPVDKLAAKMYDFKK